MNYKLIYDQIINRAKNRIIDGYVEQHHIVPKCMNGTDDDENIVALTPEEHYVCHQLLIKIYPENHKLIYAAHVMCAGKYRNNKLYGWIRRKATELRRGKRHTEEAKSKMRDALIGRPAAHITPHTEETKNKISQSRKGKGTAPKTAETRRKMSESAKGRIMSEEVKSIISQAKKGRPWTQARRDAENERKKK